MTTPERAAARVRTLQRLALRARFRLPWLDEGTPARAQAEADVDALEAALTRLQDDINGKTTPPPTNAS